jgi:hypothetical protein
MAEQLPTNCFIPKQIAYSPETRFSTLFNKRKKYYANKPAGSNLPYSSSEAASSAGTGTISICKTKNYPQKSQTQNSRHFRRVSFPQYVFKRALDFLGFGEQDGSRPPRLLAY